MFVPPHRGLGIGRTDHHLRLVGTPALALARVASLPLLGPLLGALPTPLSTASAGGRLARTNRPPPSAAPSLAGGVCRRPSSRSRSGRIVLGRLVRRSRRGRIGRLARRIEAAFQTLGVDQVVARGIGFGEGAVEASAGGLGEFDARGRSEQLAIEFGEGFFAEAVAGGVTDGSVGSDAEHEPARGAVAVGQVGPLGGGGQALGDAGEGQTQQQRRGIRQPPAARMQSEEGGEIEGVDEAVEAEREEPGGAEADGQQGIARRDGQGGGGDGEAGAGVGTGRRRAQQDGGFLGLVRAE